MNKPDDKSSAAAMEEEVLEYWKKNRIFEKSLEKAAPKCEFVFYDGPPFATGLPHYGHIVASVIKDVVPRYWTMRGYRVPRVWGWDCHGLPIENIVEKEIYDKGLVYEDYRSMHICPRCETTLSQQEVAEGYKNVKDIAVTAKFELVDEPGTYFLA